MHGESERRAEKERGVERREQRIHPRIAKRIDLCLDNSVGRALSFDSEGCKFETKHRQPSVWEAQKCAEGNGN